MSAQHGTTGTRRRAPDPFMQPAQSARAAALRHVSDATPGITRRKSGRGFTYRAVGGVPVRDRATLDRIRQLAIPPAWTDVWICPAANGHIQATGRDVRGRKQYRYHSEWHRVRDETKYERLAHFATMLPRIRRRVSAHLKLRGLPRDKVLAIVVRLLETTYIRIGNEEYARTNNSFGLTTMRDRHITVQRGQVTFRFTGKSGKAHAIAVADRRLARLVRACRDLPGQELFQYIDDDGTSQPVTSADVNDYLRSIAGDEFTAKDFRTWAGTLLMASHLVEDARRDERTPGPTLMERIREVASQLGNTPTVCRKCYIHPMVLGAFTDEKLRARWSAALSGKPVAGLRADESTLLRYLRPARN